MALSEHQRAVDYSSWLLPAVADVLECAGVSMAEVEGYAVAAGPGSFTGVRVGLTTVKAWVEVYGRPVAAVSRLEAIAEQAATSVRRMAAFVDAQRGQVFGAIYQRESGGTPSRLGEEMVIGPGKFVEEAVRLAGERTISWLSPDPAALLGEPAWREREAQGEKIDSVSPTLAPVIGLIGVRRLREGKGVDALTLDANYVRRSDAEIFWKGGVTHGR